MKVMSEKLNGKVWITADVVVSNFNKSLVETFIITLMLNGITENAVLTNPEGEPYDGNIAFASFEYGYAEYYAKNETDLIETDSVLFDIEKLNAVIDTDVEENCFIWEYDYTEWLDQLAIKKRRILEEEGKILMFS